MTEQITYEQLVELLDYNPDTGVFTWRVSRGPRAVVGAVAGTKVKGYIHIKLSDKQYKAHRLAWLWCFREWPSEMLDHINGIRDDNRLDNLREATNVENQRNRGKKSGNKTGYKGVHWCNTHNKYVAQISINRKKKFLGYFATAELASQAYETTATQHFKEFKREDTI